MKSTVGFVLFGSNQLKAADYLLSRVRKFHPDAYIMIISDRGADYTELVNKYNTEYMYCTKKIGYPVEPYGYSKENVKEFLMRMYVACVRSNTTHLVYLEEDVQIFREVTVETNTAVTGFKTCWPDGSKFPKGFPDEFINLLHKYSLRKPNVNGYGAMGGTIINTSKFYVDFEYVNEFIDKEFDNVSKYYPTIGWIDCFLTWYFLVGGHMYEQNPNAIEVSFDSLEEEHPTAQIAHGFKKYYEKKQQIHIENTHYFELLRGV